MLKNKNIMKYSADDLLDEILTVHTITCTKCKKSKKEFNCDELIAINSFFVYGWRKTISGNVYCPECCKKKLKLN